MSSIQIKSRMISISLMCDTDEDLLNALEKYTRIIKGFVMATRKKDSCSLEIDHEKFLKTLE